jgi:Phosphate-selective porin O and P
MFARTVAILTAMALAPAVAAAQEAQASAPATDPAIVEGKVDSLAEQYAETKVDVAGIKKLKFSGYLQARYAWQEAAVYGKVTGTPPVFGTPPDKDNFYIRRGRFKVVADADLTQYTLQIDAIPAGLSLKEAYVTVKLPAAWAVDAGLQLMPFGYEVASRSSSDLDLLERSQASVYFLDGEYDLGVSARGKYGPFAFRGGVFNGNGVKGANGKDNDQAKDLIGRATADFGILTAGLSGWYGKAIDYSAYVNGGRVSYDRVRAALDVQLFLDLLPIGGTFVKGEYIWGKTGIGTESSGAGKNLGRAASGAYAILGQHLGHYSLVALRYDSFINHAVDVSGATNTKVKQVNEVSAALHAFIGEGGKLSLAYYHPTNGTRGAAALADPKADRVEVQLQAKF